MKRFDVIVISGGRIERDFALDFLERNRGSFLAAADGGLRFCREQQLVPDLAVGDFDSVPEELVAFFEERGTEIVRLRPEKDDSDTQSLLRRLCERGFCSCGILGATGTRLDHVFANLEVLVWGKNQGMDLVMVDSCNRISVADREQRIRRGEQFGRYVSFFPMGGEVTGLNLEGFYYPLTDHTLSVSDCGLTLSNEITAEEATISYREGTLLMIESRD